MKAWLLKAWLALKRVAGGIVFTFAGLMVVGLGFVNLGSDPVAWRDVAGCFLTGIPLLLAGQWWLWGWMVARGTDGIGGGLVILACCACAVWAKLGDGGFGTWGELLWGFVVIAVFVAIGGFLLHEGALGGEAGRTLSDAARSLDLLVRRRYLRAPSAEGDLRAVRVRLAGEDRGIAIEAHADIPPSLVLESELEHGVKHNLLTEQVVTGDDGFDAKVWVRGDPGEALAVLTHEVRRAVVAAIESGLTVSSGAARARYVGPGLRKWRGRRAEGARSIMSLVGEAVALAESLATTQETAAALRRNFVTERNRVVRRANLACLFERFGKSEEATRAAKEGLEDPDRKVRDLAVKFILASNAAPPELRTAAADAMGSGHLSLPEGGSEGAVSLAVEAGTLTLADSMKKPQKT